MQISGSEGSVRMGGSLLTGSMLPLKISEMSKNGKPQDRKSSKKLRSDRLLRKKPSNASNAPLPSSNRNIVQHWWLASRLRRVRGEYMLAL
jgi:hypothetical protein